MDSKKIIHLRKEAEKAVAEMADGDLKLKAFEVILNHLLSEKLEKPATPLARGKKSEITIPETEASNDSAAGRILVLKDEGFFKTQKTLGEIREELETHGWHYPTTTLSGVLIELVQKRKLRRVRVKEENKKIWKYSNP